MKTICYYHDDMDGIAAATIVKMNIPDVELKKINYNDEIDIFSYSGKNLIIVDFSFPENLMKGFINLQKTNLVGTLTWIDHHKTAMEKMPDLWNDKNIKGIRSIEKSGCELTFEYFNTNNNQTPEAIKLIGDYDMWNFKYGDKTIWFGEYANMIIKEPSIELFSNEFYLKAMENGKILIQKRDEQIKKSFENGLDIIFCGYKTRMINTDKNISNLGEYCYKEKGYQIALIWSMKGKKIICGLRSNTVDVGEIAKLYGGGGHKFASGFIATLEFMNELFD